MIHQGSGRGPFLGISSKYSHHRPKAMIKRYWPEFGKQGKESVLVRWLLSHRAGLPVLDRSLAREEVLSWAPVIAAIEDQAHSGNPEALTFTTPRPLAGSLAKSSG